MSTEHIDSAIEAHLTWVERARHLTEGTLTDSTPSVSHKECAFGKMVTAGMFDNTIHAEDMEEIDQIHFLLHDMYKNIHEIVGNNKVPSKEERQQAQELFELMSEVSESLVELLEEAKTEA